MRAEALWKRIDVEGHDAALLRESGSGHRLTGMTVFEHEGRPACLSYAVDLRPDWSTDSGLVTGFVAGDPVEAIIERRADGWYLNGEPQGLAHLVDLDYGFTPATNLQQIQRLKLPIGQRVEVPVAWFDVGATKLIELPQVYEKQDDVTYSYEGPMFGYKAVLELAESGFARLYPELWQMTWSPTADNR
jgi:uncharacterized protein